MGGGVLPDALGTPAGHRLGCREKLRCASRANVVDFLDLEVQRGEPC